MSSETANAISTKQIVTQHIIKHGLEQGTNKELKKKFQNFGNQQKIKHLKQGLLSFYGRNFPNHYKQNSNFQEQWQNRNNFENQTQNNMLQQSGTQLIIYSIFLMLLSSITIWVITVERIFQTQVLSNTIFIHQIMLGIFFIDLTVKIFRKYSEEGSELTIKILILNFYKHIYLICYFSFMISYGQELSVDIETENFIYIIIFQGITVFILYVKSSKTYQQIKMMEFGLKYQNQIKIADLLLNILIQAHIFALVLFSASKINNKVNWVSSIGIQNNTAVDKYFNSFYFASTTMLTIGYGDIVPKNTGQKIITIFIQIIGVVSFGYLLNQMGHTLSKLREQSEILEKDLQTISKISKYYNLQKKLQTKAKNFVFNNQRKNEDLKEEDENRVLLKLNDDLRQQIHLQNSLTVVKSSIFFLCHWSKQLQSEIASRLEKRIFSPNQNLIWATKKDRVYIIKKGKIDILMNRFGGSEHRKLLKIIDTSEARTEVLDNIYNYTTVFSNRSVKLDAIAKEFTSTYSVTKDQFLQCIKLQSSDFEYYHEIKSRIDQSTFCQEWETPSIKNTQQHYCPSKMFIIRRHRRIQTESVNKRKDCCRIMLKKFALLLGYRNKNITFNDRISEHNNNSLLEKTIELSKYKREETQDLQDTYTEDALKHSQTNLSNQYTESQDGAQQQVNNHFQLSHELAILKMRSGKITKSFEENQNKRPIASNFEKSREYRNFFKLNNISHVLEKLEKQNAFERSHLFKTTPFVLLQFATKMMIPSFPNKERIE